MSVALICAFLFFVGAIFGYGLEFLYRNLISHNGPRLGFVINPGFCSGPYLPIYGIGLTVMFLISYTVVEVFHGQMSPMDNPWQLNLVVILAIGVAMTVIEFIGGFILLKVFNIRLWDYTESWGNIMGLICPMFSLIWMVLGLVYYLLIHPIAINGLLWLSQHLAFSFFVGAFWGVFIVDLVMSFQRASIVKEFGEDHEIVVRYEELKALMQERRVERQQKQSFFNQIGQVQDNMKNALEERADAVEIKAEKIKKAAKKKKQEVEKAVRDTQKQIDKAVDETKKQAEKAVKDTKKQVSKAAKQTKKKVEKTVKATKKKVEKKLK